MKSVLVLVALLVSVPASAQDRVGPAPYLVLTVGSGYDLATTLHALHTVPGAVEANPFLSHGGTPGLVAGKVAATAALGYVMNRMGVSGHPRAAKVLGYVAGIAMAGIGARNARVGR